MHACGATGAKAIYVRAVRPLRFTTVLIGACLTASCGASCPPMQREVVVQPSDDLIGESGVVDSGNAIREREPAVVAERSERETEPRGDSSSELDRDGDRIADRCDRCPVDAETYNGDADDDGCPERLAPLEPEVLFFGQRQTDITIPHLPFLRKLATLLALGAEVLIEGHSTDGEPFPVATAEARSRTVRDALVALGAPAGQIMIVGRGRERMVDHTANREGRAANRRVTFEITDTLDPRPVVTHDPRRMPATIGCPSG